MFLLIFLNISVLLGMAAVVLHFSDITSDPKWERWCGQALLFTIIPVLIPTMVLFLGIPVSPFYIVIVIWLLLILLLYTISKSKHVQEEQEMKQEGVWKCSQCHEPNQKLNLVCEKCGAEKPS